MLFTNPEQVNGDDDAISKESNQPCIPNYDPNNTWTSDHYALRATLGSYGTLLTKVKSEIRDKVINHILSTVKRRGASSEQLEKIGEWVSGTIDFILAKGDVTGIIAWSWNLLNRADGFFLPGDLLKDKDANLKSLIDKFKGVEKAAEERKKKMIVTKEKVELKEVEEKFKRDGEYYHWEQEVIRLAHFYAKEKAKEKAEAEARRIRKAKKRAEKNKKKGQRRRKESEQRAAARRNSETGITQDTVPFGKARGMRKGFTLRF